MSVPATNPNITGAYYVSYSSPYSKAVSFTYINDPNLVLYSQGGIAYATGGFRPMAATDFSSSLPSVSTNGISGSLSAITTGVILPANPNRSQFGIQVVGSGAPLFVLYGNGIVSQSLFNVLLKADTANYAGNGGILTNDTYTGPVSVSGGAGCLFTVWQA